MLELRPYQEELISGTRAHFRAKRKRVLIQLATGGGKTAICARILHNAINRARRAWFCVHRRELGRQVSKALTLEGVPHGLIMPGARVNLAAPVQVCSIPTLVNRLGRLPPPDLIAYDECHHIGANSWSLIAKTFPNAYQLGLSATPVRLDGIGLANYFDAMVCGPSVHWLIERGFLSKYMLFAPETIDRGAIGKRAGEYIVSQSEAAVQAIVGNVLSHYRKHADGARAILFAASVKQSREFAALFNGAGIPAYHLDGQTDDTVRDGVLDDLVSGKIKVVCNVDLFSEGVDCPALEAVIDLAPTMSMSKYRQRVGRMLRAFPGKEYGIYLDCVGNSEIHGKPDDDIEWHLTSGAVVKKKPAVGSPRTCTYCWAQTPAGRPKCKICRRPFPVNGRVIAQVDGELTLKDHEHRQEIIAKRDSRKEQGMAKTLEALQALGKMRYGEDKGIRWAQYIWNSRLKKEQS